jgi:hypothetical protein
LCPPSRESAWLIAIVTSTPLLFSFAAYSSNFSGSTSNATWFIEPIAL